MDPISTIQGLVDELNDSDPARYADIINRIEIPKTEFLPFASWSSDKYTRNCIARTDDYELILLCWEPFQTTPIHGHGGQKCWVYQVDGAVTELRFIENPAGELVKTNQEVLQPGQRTFMSDQAGYHLLNNKNPFRSMTLHIYVAPIDTCRVFNNTNKQFEHTELTYDSEIGNIPITH